ncbi:hypothetical protein NBRC10512_000728 [Rhodotorula toruloides]|uniref:RHTO0S27e00496g1_1 n=2 Tax=Rhodotorula toruloides TaxID=5286 RepID=A0A061BHK7_RHOTO|nr:uncharacterized protein RHTO_07948 [Rhodotorula toruloides NP11]EMS22595.1 hypothetical protein RHTO_07948 [Rhodotorula toruloides NP11]KAJ8292934.1 hypothetical protein OF846_003661 [Rhodotorula toruloides]CDR49476.1 RHTO0S27e00496g1_1 [Rhodotorula toruloides]
MTSFTTMEDAVHAILEELKVEGIDEQNFNAWLAVNQQNKVEMIAQALRRLKDLDTRTRTKKTDAFLSSVFWLKETLLLEPTSLRMAYLRTAHVDSFLSTIRNATVSHYNFTHAMRQDEEAKAKLLRFLADWKKKMLRAWYAVFEERSLVKPSIGRRVALMHGTTKQRWERQARAF